MKKLFGFLLLLALPVRSAVQPPQAGRPLVLTHVTVIDATGAPAQPDRTVVIRGDRISEIGPAATLRPPQDAQVVDGTGKFLIPGLWDMHVHWYNKDFFSLFIANGVTGIRVMWGGPFHQQWRQEIERGDLPGPRMSIASPIVDGPNPIWPGSVTVKDAAEGRQIVIGLKPTGADFIKVYNRLPRDAYFAILDEAKKQGIPVAGHVPDAVSAIEASDAGQQSIEHFTGILEGCSTQEDEIRKAREEVWAHLGPGERIASVASRRPLVRRMLETFSPEKADALLAHLARNHTWQCPTLTVLRNLAFLDDPKTRDDPRLKYMPSDIRTAWNPKDDFRLKDRTPEDFELARTAYRRQMELVGRMRKAGVEILAGTDVINPYVFPGFSLHDELKLLVQAGLSPLEALQTATRNPARFLGREKDLGTVEKGKIADLVLLDASPLDDIGNSQKIQAVVVGGKLYPKAELQQMLVRAEAASDGD